MTRDDAKLIRKEMEYHLETAKNDQKFETNDGVRMTHYHIGRVTALEDLVYRYHELENTITGAVRSKQKGEIK